MIPALVLGFLLITSPAVAGNGPACGLCIDCDHDGICDGTGPYGPAPRP